MPPTPPVLKTKFFTSKFRFPSLQMPPAIPPLKLPCLCSSPPSLAPLPPLFLLIRRPSVVASVRAMLTATLVSPPVTSSPSALTAAPVHRDVSSFSLLLYAVQVQVDFDDKTSWEYLFKVYWVLLKEKLALNFKYVKTACCGSGTLNAQGSCTPISDLCLNRNEYLFWDSSHLEKRFCFFILLNFVVLKLQELREASANIEPKHQNDVADLINS
ncbi:hypothetical protein Gotur_006688, partial [Gossypium turneri]